MVIQLDYIIFYDEYYDINENKYIQLKKIKKKNFIKDYHIKINKEYMNKEYLKNQLIIEYFTK
jgi:hypothetical protein|tara:strand:+ start:833 stop:1021 length:189 start_codon:yes stop_codon:yes gene_type:complete